MLKTWCCAIKTTVNVKIFVFPFFLVNFHVCMLSFTDIKETTTKLRSLVHFNFSFLLLLLSFSSHCKTFRLIKCKWPSERFEQKTHQKYKRRIVQILYFVIWNNFHHISTFFYAFYLWWKKPKKKKKYSRIVSGQM